MNVGQSGGGGVEGGLDDMQTDHVKNDGRTYVCNVLCPSVSPQKYNQDGTRAFGYANASIGSASFV